MPEIRSHGGLRGIAALLVVAYHLQFRAGHLPVEDLTSFFRRSYLMVDLFFILSGFVMAYVYCRDEVITMTVKEARKFWKRRLIRIYPLHFFMLVVLVLYAGLLTALASLMDLSVEVDWSTQKLVMLAAQFLLVNAWLPGPNSWNIPSWSISAEFFAYAIFPLLVWITARLPRLSVAFLGSLSALYYISATSLPSLDITGGMGAPLRCVAGFALGFLLHRYRGHFANANIGAISVAQLLTVMASVAVMVAPVHDSLAIPAFGLLVGLTWTDRGIVSAFLGSPMLRWFGEISYAVYIVHVFVLMSLSFAWDRSIQRLIPDPIIERALFIMVTYLVVVGAAAFLHFRIDEPVRRRLNELRCASRSKPLQLNAF